MVFVPGTDVVQIELRYLVYDIEVENTLYFWRTTTVDNAALVAMVDNISDWWYNHLRTHQTYDLEYRSTYGRLLTTENSITNEDTTYAGTHGSGSGTAAPNNVTQTVTFKTGYAGRSARGRNYLCALSEGAVTDNEISSTFCANVVTTYERLKYGGSHYLTGWWWVVVSRFHNHVARTSIQRLVVNQVAINNLYVKSRRWRLPR
jgi:hypothetical protein